MENSKEFKFKNRTIDIFGSKWRIKYVDEIKVDDDTYVLGTTNCKDKVILIDKNQDINEISITILHELFHAIMLTGQYLGSNEDEPLIEFLARSINSLMKQNMLQWKQ